MRTVGLKTVGLSGHLEVKTLKLYRQAYDGKLPKSGIVRTVGLCVRTRLPSTITQHGLRTPKDAANDPPADPSGVIY